MTDWWFQTTAARIQAPAAMFSIPATANGLQVFFCPLLRYTFLSAKTMAALPKSPRMLRLAGSFGQHGYQVGCKYRGGCDGGIRWLC